jgi:DNA-binding response OmpR family regulator
MSAIVRILNVSRDRAILLARNDALAVAGFSVVSPREPSEALQILATTNIDVIILGHSIPFEERGQLSREFHQISSNVPIIVLFKGVPEEREQADAFVSIDEGSEVLIHAIHRCLKTRSGRAQGA